MRKGTLLQKGSLDPPKNLKQWEWCKTAGVKLGGSFKLEFCGPFENFKFGFIGEFEVLLYGSLREGAGAEGD